MPDSGAHAGAAPRLCPVHRTAHRLRLRFVGAAPEGAALHAFADGLAGLTGVIRARARPNTGSVILDTALPAETVLQTLRSSGLARIERPPKPPPVGQVIQMGLFRADAAIGDRTGGALDFRTTLALALLGGAILQLGRGRVAGPATTLAISALALLDRPAKR